MKPALLLSLIVVAISTSDAQVYLNSLGLPWPGARAEVRTVVNPSQTQLTAGNPQPITSSADLWRIGFANAIAAADNGDVYFSDVNASTVSRLSPNGTVDLLVGTPFVARPSCNSTCAGTDMTLMSPVALAVQPGNPFRSLTMAVLIADRSACAIYSMNASGFVTLVLGRPGVCGTSPAGSPVGQVTLSSPSGVAASGEFSASIGGSVPPFVYTEPFAQRVMVQRAGFIQLLASSASLVSPAAAEMVCPTAVVLDILAQAAYVSDPCASFVLRLGIDKNAVGIPSLDAIIAGIPFSSGYSGDGGPATSAQLFFPLGLALTLRGSLLIAEAGDDLRSDAPAAARVRFVYLGATNTCSLIYTLAGGNANSTDAANTSAPVLAADARLRNLRQLAASPRAGAQGVYYATDGRRIVIVYINPPPAPLGAGTCGSGVLRGLVGRNLPWWTVTDSDGSIYLQNPQGVAVHGLTGDIYVSDATTHLVRRVSVDKNSGLVNISTVIGVAGDSTPLSNSMDWKIPARRYTLSSPRGIALDTVYNRLFVVDSNASALRVVDLRNGSVWTPMGSGSFGHTFDFSTAYGATLPFPTAVAYDPGTRIIFVAEQYVSQLVANTSCVRMIMPDNVLGTLAGQFAGTPLAIADGVAASRVALRNVVSLHWDFASATMYLIDFELHLAMAVPPSGRLRLLANAPTLIQPVSIAYSARSGSVFIGEAGGSLMELRPATGTRIWLVPRQSSGGSGSGSAASFYGAGRALLPNSFPLPDVRLQQPVGLAAAFSAAGDTASLYVADAGAGMLLRADCDAPGPQIVPAAPCDAAAGSILSVSSVANTNGTISTPANGQLSSVAATTRRFAVVSSVVFSPDGRVFVVDQNASCIYVILQDGSSSLFAGVPWLTSQSFFTRPTSAACLSPTQTIA